MYIKTSLYFWFLEFCFHAVDIEICVYVCLRYGEGENQPFSLSLTAPQTLRDIQAKTFISTSGSEQEVPAHWTSTYYLFDSCELMYEQADNGQTWWGHP